MPSSSEGGLLDCSFIISLGFDFRSSSLAISVALLGRSLNIGPPLGRKESITCVKYTIPRWKVLAGGPIAAASQSLAVGDPGCHASH